MIDVGHLRRYYHVRPLVPALKMRRPTLSRNGAIRLAVRGEAIFEGHGKANHMDAELKRVLERAYPGEEARYFSPMSIGTAPEHADEGVALILSGVKTLTSSGFWNYPDGKIPFVGALSVLVDGAGRPRGIVETTRVEIMPFRTINEEMAQDYGEGERTADWWRRVMGEFYQTSAARHGAAFTDETALIWEWFAVVRRL
jgi:uncharacterized protein YhfF